MIDYKNISKEEFKSYIKATRNKISYCIDECKESGLLPNKFIYIADHFNELKEKYGGK